MFRLILFTLIGLGAFVFGTMSMRQVDIKACLEAGGTWRYADNVCTGIE